MGIKISLKSKTYRIYWDADNWCLLNVEEDPTTGYATLTLWRVNGKQFISSSFRFPEDELKYETFLTTWERLVDSDLVELRPIGPEDSEYFTTGEFDERINPRSTSDSV